MAPLDAIILNGRVACPQKCGPLFEAAVMYAKGKGVGEVFG